MTTTNEHAVPRSKQHGQTQLEFGNPPVAETAIGFYFQKIEGWNVLHHGALWERFRTEYPKYEFLPAILEAPPEPNIALDVAYLPIRVGFVNNTKTQLVQVQNGLLLHNWRKTAEMPEYQHYDAMRSRLRQDWNTLRDFLKSISLKHPLVTRCQMDYFNHLVRGEGWQDFSEIPKLFTVWRGIKQLPTTGLLQTVSFNVSYRLDSGTVNVAVQPAIRANDGKELIQFTLSSSVAPANSEDEALFSCLDECHNNAARALVEFTTDEARESWRQKR